MKNLHKVTFILLVIGGLNWLLYGILGWDIGSKLFGTQDITPSRIIYILVGLSAIAEIVMHKKNCRDCSTQGMSS